MVIIIDPLVYFLSDLTESQQQILYHKLNTLCHVANKIGVPVVISALKETDSTARTGCFFDQEGIPLFTRAVANPWDDRALRKAVVQYDPAYLVIAGFWGEVSLNMMAMSALRDGHEVFLLMDCCPDLERPIFASQLEYMVRATIAPVTWRQVIFEWARHQPLILTEKLLSSVLEETAAKSELISALQVQD
ncbi:MAG: isochorismatase family protein [Kordiimonas sp.]